MKQSAIELLPGTMVKNKVGEIGRLVKLTMNLNGQYCWIVDWPIRGYSDNAG
jgi:hypothetical protein